MYNSPYSGPVTEVTQKTLSNVRNLDIVAFYYASPGACGEHGDVEFITKDCKVFHTNYLDKDTGIEWDDLCSIFPALRDDSLQIKDGTNAGWIAVYLGLGNTLFIKKEYYFEFIDEAEGLLNPETSLYNVWDYALIKVLEKESKTDPVTVFSESVCRNPEMQATERWMLFVNCFYKDKPRLASLLRSASITEEDGRKVIAIPVRMQAQEQWLSNGPLGEIRELFAKHSQMNDSDYRIILKRADDFASD